MMMQEIRKWAVEQCFKSYAGSIDVLLKEAEAMAQYIANGPCSDKCEEEEDPNKA